MDTFKIFNDGYDVEVSISEYKTVRNKIKNYLSKFYKDVTFKDAGIDSADIIYFCSIYGRSVIKKFNAIEWIEFEREGVFNEKYTEFTKSKQKSSISIGKLVEKSNNKFRKKRL